MLAITGALVVYKVYVFMAGEAQPLVNFSGS